MMRPTKLHAACAISILSSMATPAAAQDGTGVPGLGQLFHVVFLGLAALVAADILMVAYICVPMTRTTVGWLLYVLASLVVAFVNGALISAGQWPSALFWWATESFDSPDQILVACVPLASLVLLVCAPLIRRAVRRTTLNTSGGNGVDTRDAPMDNGAGKQRDAAGPRFGSGRWHGPR
jgi:hypothetical protein